MSRPDGRVHEMAAAGFSSGADAYERGRPSYPAAAVDHVVAALGLGPGRRVVDVGAGTGKWTRLLVPSGAEVVAVEPVAEMRAKLPVGVEAVDGTAEALPLPDGSVDAVTIAQAFHWFEPAPALAEIARVLRPGGGLALVWNVRDERVPWVAELTRVTRWASFDRGRYHDTDWAAVVREHAAGAFGAVSLTTFGYAQELDEDGLVDRFASVSYIAAMAPDERAEILDAVRAVVSGFPARFELPYLTNVWTATRC